MEVAAIVALLTEYRYLILFPLACLEGPMLGFISGTLVPVGYFSPVPLLLVLVAADVLPDCAYWALGRWGGNKPWVGRMLGKVGLNPTRIGGLHTLWHTHTVKAMLITKFSYGLSTPLLLTGGLVHVPFKKFVLLSAALATLQYGVLVALGYFFGNYFALIESGLVRAQIVVAAAVVVFALYYFFTTSVRKAFWRGAASVSE